MRKGFTCGAFDLCHSGHIVMLKEAKQNCDYLIVGLQTDPSIDRPDKNKPIQSMYERYTQLKAVKYIDEIIPYDTERSLLDLLEATEIHLRFVGEEYIDQDFTGKGLHEIFYTNRKHSFSRTTLKERIQRAFLRK